MCLIVSVVTRTHLGHVISWADHILSMVQFWASFLLSWVESFEPNSTCTIPVDSRIWIMPFDFDIWNILTAVFSLIYTVKMRSTQVLFCPPQMCAPALPVPWFRAGRFSLFSRAWGHANSSSHRSCCQAFHPQSALILFIFCWVNESLFHLSYSKLASAFVWNEECKIPSLTFLGQCAPNACPNLGVVFNPDKIWFPNKT